MLFDVVVANENRIEILEMYIYQEDFRREFDCNRDCVLFVREDNLLNNSNNQLRFYSNRIDRQEQEDDVEMINLIV